MSKKTDNEIYLMQADVPVGPYARRELAELVADGAVDPNGLARIGLTGKVFPAHVLINMPLGGEAEV